MFGHAALGGHDIHDARFAHRQGAGLVEDNDIELCGVFQRRRVLEQNAATCAEPGADHDRHRCGQSERIGAGDHEDRDCQGHGKQQCFTDPPEPDSKRSEANDDRDQNKPLRRAVGEQLRGCLRVLCLLHKLDDLRERCVSAHLGRPVAETAALVDRCPDDFVSGGFRDGHGFAGEHRFIDLGAAFQNLPVDRNLVARADKNNVAFKDIGCWDFYLISIAKHDCHRRCQIEQCPDRRRSPCPRAHFQPVSEKDEHKQDGDRLVELHAWEEERRADTEEIAGANGKHDEHSHIEDAVAQRSPGSDHKWPDRIQHGCTRQAEQPQVEFQSEGRGWRSEKAAHRGVDENRDREDEGNPETVAHVAYHLLHVHACPVAHFLGHFVLRPALAVVVVNCLFSPAVRTAPRSPAGFRKICFRRFADMLRHDAATAAETAAFDQALKPRPIGLGRVVFHGHAAPRRVCSGPAYAGFMPQLLLHAEVIEFFKEISDF